MLKLRDIIDIHNGDEFEKMCRKLLELMYGATSFQEIPATDQGDFGLDGYTFEPEAFQCYAPEKLYTTEELYNKQRDKITADIVKFIKNEKKLKELVGDKKFKKWVFLTPTFDSKRLNVHAGKKTKEVLGKKLAHVANDFQIVLKEADNFFRTEIETYRNKTRRFLNITNPEIAGSEVINWQDNNTTLTETLRRKLSKLGMDDDSLNRCINLHIKYYLALNKIMKETFKKNEDVYNEIVQAFAAKTRSIEMKSSMNEVKKLDDIRYDLDQLEMMLKEKLDGFIKPEIREHLKTCKISDWLIMCPLDFK